MNPSLCLPQEHFPEGEMVALSLEIYHSVHLLVLKLTSYMTPENLLDLSVPQLPHLR